MRVLRISLLTLCVASATPVHADESCTAEESAIRSDSRRWYKGNLHSHSVTFLRGFVPHGDSGPASVARWYKDNGYDFAALTDHNRLTHPDDPRLAGVQTDEFILIPGVEITSDYRLHGTPQEGKRSVHTTALNVNYVPDWDFEGMSNAEIVAAHLERTAAAGGIAIVSHPNYREQLTVEDLLGLADLRLLEVYNSHPGTRNQASATRLSTEQIWDTLLTAGARVFGVATDDAHYFKFPNLLTHERRNFALPGAAWVMVGADTLTPGAIVRAVAAGDFYSTTGVALRALRFDENRYEVAVDVSATVTNMSDPVVVEGSRRIDTGDEGVKIEFIANGGTVIKSASCEAASVDILPEYDYVRAKVTWVQRIHTRIDDGAVLREFAAWTQPAFPGSGRSLPRSQ